MPQQFLMLARRAENNCSEGSIQTYLQGAIHRTERQKSPDVDRLNELINEYSTPGQWNII